ncbi:hypothetical protein LX97_03146 [Nonlabens dokdonensis]|uniref:Heat shock protein 90 n=2 Tax=Nonlabens dokdonensis TaxID=328515 RepID=L7WD87_NONDD|nr:DUF6503 family protein [Nonlabens dokdonensis]AGC78059.1 heat shock protein 90 [Nonlabens dokdonensis DSW-6]PZX37124.1 hypothetical protein LX97_03146 [Nonlabens dokdonensis]
MKKVSLLFVILILFAACKEATTDKVLKEETSEKTEINENATNNAFTQSMEEAHQKEAFLKNDAVQYDFQVSFGGNVLLDAKITQKTDGSMVRIDNQDGTVILADQDEVFSSPEIADNSMTRFHAYTWSYFFALPYKLNDPGTQWSDEKNLTFGEQQYPTSKLTFENGVGDTSDDWYVVYKNPSSNVLEGVAYIVSYGKGVEKAEEEPHFAKYNDYDMMEGIPVSTNWTFHNWNKEEGFTDQIGKASIKNVNFLDDASIMFEQNEEMVAVPMPTE